MSVCSHTGITIPECSCPRCIQEQLKRVQPSVFAVGQQPETARDTSGGRRRRLAA